MKANKILHIMESLDQSNYKKILIDGAWGIGKTKYILDYRDGQESVYYISLFGKKNMESVLQDLSYLIMSRNRKIIRKVTKIVNIDLSFYGLNFTVPMINDLYKDILKDLEGKSITIILDDLERMHESLDIREVFGFVESVTKENDIKVIYVANAGHFPENIKSEFKNYSEKSIDRTYKITSYANDAPKNILGHSMWEDVKDIHKERNFFNLRTFIKSRSFMEEVMQELPSNCFTDKFNKIDLHKICFAVVLLVTDYNKNQETKGQSEKEIIQKQIAEIWHNILERNTKTNEMYHMVEILLHWYKVGEYSQSQLKYTIQHINNYQETLPPIFMSEEQIKIELDKLTKGIFSKDVENMAIREILQRIDELVNIAEKMDLAFSKDYEQIIKWIKESIGGNEELEERILYRDILSMKKSTFVKELINKLKEEIKQDRQQRVLQNMELILKKSLIAKEDEKVATEFKRFIDDTRGEKIKRNNSYLTIRVGERTE